MRRLPQHLSSRYRQFSERPVKKAIYIPREMMRMISRHKLYFVAPLLIMLACLAGLVFYAGPTVLISFLYAGV